MSRSKKIKHVILYELIILIIASVFLIYQRLDKKDVVKNNGAREVIFDEETFNQDLDLKTKEEDYDSRTSMYANNETRELNAQTNENNNEDNEETNEKTLDKKNNENSEESDNESSQKKDFIKWVDFNVTTQALDKAYKYDVESRDQGGVQLNWIELLAYLGAKYGGNFSNYKEKDLNKLVEVLKSKEENIQTLTEKMKYYKYYYEVYETVLGGLVGEYEIQVKSEENPEEKVWIKKYGLKGFSPIAKFYEYNDYDDFGVSRSYGYKRNHLGHDMMGQVGTPIVAVESGYVEALGWNQYGGWRIGIRSFDGKRYYYYAHLRKNFPYNKSLEVGSIVQSGDVIGYLGRTGYSKNENVNNIQTSHLHFGLQLIFDESQKECYNEIWIDCYQLVKFLYKNRCETVKNLETKDYYRVYDFRDPAVNEYLKNKELYEQKVKEKQLRDDQEKIYKIILDQELNEEDQQNDEQNEEQSEEQSEEVNP